MDDVSSARPGDGSRTPGDGRGRLLMVWDGIKRFRCPLRGWLAVLLPEQIGNLPGFGGTRRDVGPHRHDGKMNILRFQYRKKAMRQVKQPGFADAQRQILRVGLSGKHPASQQDRAFSTRPSAE